MISKDLRQPTLTELMAMSGIQVLTSPNNGNLSNPKDVGTGFLLKHKGEVFFVTVRHVVNALKKDTNGNEVEEDNQLAIITNRYRINELGLKEGELYSIGGFYTFEFFNILQSNPEAERVEVAFTIIENKKLQELKLKTVGVKNYETGEIIIEEGRGKFILISEMIVHPNVTDTYYCSGLVQAHWEQANSGEQVLASRYIFHNEMKYDRMEGDFIVLKTPEYASKENWGGLSGSPVINQEGGIVGILNGGKEGTHDIYVLNFGKVLMLMDNVLKIETMNRLNMENTFELEEIYSTISDSQADELKKMVQSYGEEEAAMKWLEDIVAPTMPVTPYEGTIGDNTPTKPFKLRVKDELDMLICGHPKYNEEREKILEQAHGWTLVAATSAAAILAPLFGVSVGVILPAILLFVRCAGKLSINAYCQNIHFEEK